MVNVGRAQALLGAMLVGLVVGAGFLRASTLPPAAQILLGVLAGLLFVTAATVLAATFLSLDENGRIRSGTLFHSYLTIFFDKTPQFLGVCQIFWLMAIGYAVFMACVAIVGLLVVGIGLGFVEVVEIGSVHPLEVLLWTGVSVGGLVVCFLAGKGFFDLCQRYSWLEKLFVGLLVTAVVALVLFVIGVTSWVAPIMNRVEYHDASVGAAILWVAGWWFIGWMCFFATIALITGLVVAAIKLFPWFRNTASAKFLVDVLHNACPSLGIAK